MRLTLVYPNRFKVPNRTHIPDNGWYFWEIDSLLTACKFNGHVIVKMFRRKLWYKNGKFIKATSVK